MRQSLHLVDNTTTPPAPLAHSKARNEPSRHAPASSVPKGRTTENCACFPYRRFALLPRGATKRLVTSRLLRYCFCSRLRLASSARFSFSSSCFLFSSSFSSLLFSSLLFSSLLFSSSFLFSSLSSTAGAPA